jgi:hypothetical protein
MLWSKLTLLQVVWSGTLFLKPDLNAEKEPGYWWYSLPPVYLSESVQTSVCDGFKKGQTYRIIFVQDAKGGKTVAPCKDWEPFRIDRTPGAYSVLFYRNGKEVSKYSAK